ncbi:MAG: type 1 glutamine amidotransferase [Phycisphaeraceae bacterium]|nr:type 1 glutamine amidotransferase [Phycisphaeraceae bacterium]
MQLTGRRVLIFVGDDYEDLELQYPKYRLREAGAEVVVAGLEAGVTHQGKHGYPQLSEAKLADLSANDFDGLVVPGGWMPDKLRRYEEVLSITDDIHQQGKCIASICHGAWINISANVVKGYRYTSTPGIKDDLINAGVSEWVNEETVIDRHHVSARRPDDCPAFCRALIEVMSR